MSCPNCGGTLVVIDPNWSGCHQLNRSGGNQKSATRLRAKKETSWMT